MGKSTFDEESENQYSSKATFPTFRRIPSGILKITRAAPSTFLKMGKCVGRGWKKSWHYLLAIIIIIAIPYVALDIYASAQLNNQLNLIRQKGEPLTSAEAAPPKVLDSENAAILYNRASAALKLKLKIKYAPENISRKEIAEILAQNTTAIQLIRQATSKPECRFDLGWEHKSAIEVIPTETDLMRNLSRLLTLQVLYEAESGNTTAALQDIRRLFIMTDHLSREPLLQSAFNALYMDSDANVTLSKVLSHTPLTLTQAQQYEASLPQIDWSNVVYGFLLTSQTETVEEFQISFPISQWKEYNGFTAFPDTFIWYLEYAIKPLRKLDEARALDFWKMILMNVKSVPINMVADSEVGS